VLFITPLIVLSLHAFSNHEHGVCFSKVETHLHQKDADCSLDLIKQNDTFFSQYTFEESKTFTFNVAPASKYQFLKNHYKLSFSLRGPPQII